MFGWFKSRAQKEAEKELQRLMNKTLSDPSEVNIIASLNEKETEVYFTIMQMASITNSMVSNVEKLTQEEADAKTFVFALEEDKVLKFAEEQNINPKLLSKIKSRRDELWSPEGIIGKQAAKYKKSM